MRVLLGVPAGVLMAAAAAGSTATPAQLEAGKRAYERYCAQCHGETGDGQGAAAPHLLPKPRDFTTGKYKLRSTPSGALPTDEDLRRVIRTGMPYTSMPAWPGLTDAEVENLVQYIKGFYDGFADASLAPQPIELPRAPAMSSESVEKGKAVYASLGCARCHGETGRGEGPSAPTLRDDKGDQLRAADLSYRWTFRGGPSREDIFRTFSTGLNGTPMPSFFDSLETADRWALTDYVYSLGDADTPGYATLLVASPLEEVLDASRGAALFDGAAMSRFPIVGQIVEPGRDFSPTVTAVEVKAVFDQQRIAFLVRWHDIRADTGGTNAPVLEVPLSEEAFVTPVAPEAGEGGFWGEEEEPAAPAGDDFWEEAAPAAETAPAAEFSDAVAIQLPLQPPQGIFKPYFLFGDGQNAVDLWFLDLARPRVRQYVGRGSGALTLQEASEVEGSGSWEAGQWSAVFVRDLRSTSGISLAEGQYMPIAFSIWDGTARERGNRRGLTQWFYVYLPPREKPSLVAPMLRAALGVSALELLVVFGIRRRRGTIPPAA